jgi:hypothetical protein
MTTDIWSYAYISSLSDNDIQNFQDIVSKDVKNEPLDNFDKEILFNNLDLWLYSLRLMRKNAELQLSNFKCNLKSELFELQSQNSDSKNIEIYIISQHKRRNGIVKFLNSVEKKILYVKLLLQEEPKKQ